MLAEDHYSSQSIQGKTREVRERWTELQRKMAERGDKLRQAGQQEQLMELLRVLKLKLCSTFDCYRTAMKDFFRCIIEMQAEYISWSSF